MKNKILLTLFSVLLLGVFSVQAKVRKFRGPGGKIFVLNEKNELRMGPALVAKLENEVDSLIILPGAKKEIFYIERVGGGSHRDKFGRPVISPEHFYVKRLIIKKLSKDPKKPSDVSIAVTRGFRIKPRFKFVGWPQRKLTLEDPYGGTFVWDKKTSKWIDKTPKKDKLPRPQKDKLQTIKGMA